MSSFRFSLLATSGTARSGTFSTPHGLVDTPGFMPVGTQGTVKGVTVDQLRATGAQMILGNTYHLFLRPGHERIARLGGLHAFSGWEGPILTDSGGFQIFSLADLAHVTESAAEFRSHIDGSKVRLSPEDAIKVQEALGSDVAMVLDHVVALPAERSTVEQAMERSLRWAVRCLHAATRADQAKFAIVQGGLDVELRRQCATELAKHPFEGFAVGGLSVGEAPVDMYRTISATTIHLPEDRPRYLMGVGRPIDLIEGVARAESISLIASCQPAMVATPWPLLMKAHFGSAMRATKRTPVPSKPIVPVPHAAIAEHIYAISFKLTRCSARFSCPSTT